MKTGQFFLVGLSISCIVVLLYFASRRTTTFDATPNGNISPTQIIFVTYASNVFLSEPPIQEATAQPSYQVTSHYCNYSGGGGSKHGGE